MDPALKILAVITFAMNAAMCVGGIIWWFSTRNAEANVTARDLSTKAEKHEVAAVEKRLDSFERLNAVQVTEIRTTLAAGLGDIRADLRDEHAKRGRQYDTIADTLTKLSGEMIGLKTTVDTHAERIAALERRVEGRGVLHMRESDAP